MPFNAIVCDLVAHRLGMRIYLPLTISVLALIPACGLIRSESSNDDSSSPSPSSTSSSQGEDASDAGTAVYGIDATLPPVAASCNTLPAPKDCGEFSSACGNATPLAAGGDTVLVQDLAVTNDSIYFLGGGGEVTPCPAGFYRVSKTGGDATLALVTSGGVGPIEADDTTLYFAESASGTETFVAYANGSESVIGTLSASSGEDYGDSLIATAGGVVAYDAEGPTNPSFLLLTPSGLRTIAANVGDGAYLGSAPAYDGNTLFFSWSAPSSVSSAPQTSENLTLVATTENTSSSRMIGANATARNDESVAVDDSSVFYFTGDPGSKDAPMGVLRVSKNGGPVTPLVPPDASRVLMQMLIDDENIYFSAETSSAEVFEIIAVPKVGGAPRIVWSGAAYPASLHLDANNLYFWIAAGEGGEAPKPGGFILSVPKNATAP